MDRRALERITSYIAVSAAIAVTASFGFGGLRLGVGALLGATVALLNWASMRWILGRVQGGSTRTRAALMTLLTGKIGLLFLAVWLVVSRLRADVTGFSIGLGALVVGLTLGGLASSSPDGAAIPDAPNDQAREKH